MASSLLSGSRASMPWIWSFAFNVRYSSSWDQKNEAMCVTSYSGWLMKCISSVAVITWCTSFLGRSSSVFIFIVRRINCCKPFELKMTVINGSFTWLLTWKHNCWRWPYASHRLFLRSFSSTRIVNVTCNSNLLKSDQSGWL